MIYKEKVNIDKKIGITSEELNKLFDECFKRYPKTLNALAKY